MFVTTGLVDLSAWRQHRRVEATSAEACVLHAPLGIRDAWFNIVVESISRVHCLTHGRSAILLHLYRRLLKAPELDSTQLYENQDDEKRTKTNIRWRFQNFQLLRMALLRHAPTNRTPFLPSITRQNEVAFSSSSLQFEGSHFQYGREPSPGCSLSHLF